MGAWCIQFRVDSCQNMLSRANMPEATIFTAVVGGCFGHVGATQHVLAAVHSELVQVAQSLYLDSFLIGEAADGFGTPGAQTDKSDAHGFDRFAGQPHYIGLSGRAGWCGDTYLCFGSL